MRKREIDSFFENAYPNFTHPPQKVTASTEKPLKRALLKIVIKMLKCSHSQLIASGRGCSWIRTQFFFKEQGAGYWEFDHALISIWAR